MNVSDNIYHFAQCNGRRCFPKTYEDDLNHELPYMRVFKDYRGNWDIAGFNYESHDNAPRMSFYCQYFKNYIFPNVTGDIEGYYNIELHDSYTYLGNQKSYENVLTFSKHKQDIGPVLIPDPYMVGNWGDVKVVDTKKWKDKDDIVCFYGTSTGCRDPCLNRRISMCIWARNRPGFDFAITKVAQMLPKDIINITGLDGWKDIYRPANVTFEEQLNHKFIYLPDGNTCKFDVWNYFTNTLSFKDTSDDMMWYYPMLMDKQHYVEVDEFVMENKRMYYLNNPQEAKHITSTAKKLAKDLFTPNNHILYTTGLFETIASNGK